MRCPFCKQNIRIQGRFCPKCGEQIFGLPVERPGHQAGEQAPSAPPSAQPSGEPSRPVGPPAPSRPAPPPDSVSVDIDFDEELAPVGGGTGQVQAADERYVGKICPYCRFPIKPGEEIMVCPQCGVPHHFDCWRENQGCTTYGCTGGTPAAQTLTRGGPLPSQTSGGPWPQPQPLSPDVQRRVETTFAQLQVGELNARATNALVLSLLGILCFLPAMIGFFMGLAVLGQGGQIGAFSNHPARGRAIAAVIIGLFFLIMWGVIVLSGTAGAGR